jgi:hypothetical protein
MIMIFSDRTKGENRVFVLEEYALAQNEERLTNFIG